MSFAIVASDWSIVVTSVLPVSTSNDTIGIFASIAAATGAFRESVKPWSTMIAPGFVAVACCTASACFALSPSAS